MYILDTTRDKTRDIYALDTTQPLKIQTITQCQVYGYIDFYGQTSYNYKLL